MEQINIVELEKPSGYCSVEIYHGDITKIPEPVDLLVVSAFKGSFYPTPGTVLGALNSRLGICVEELFKKKIINLRDSLNCWVTENTDNETFKRIMVVEIVGGASEGLIDINKIFRNLFIAISVIGQIGNDIKTLALPSLGTGRQNLDFKATTGALLVQLGKQLEKGLDLERIMFVEYNKDKSKMLSDALDKTLNRVTFRLPVDEVITRLKDDILSSIKRNASKEFLQTDTYLYLKRTFENPSARSVEFGLACRRLAENLFSEMYFPGETGSRLSFHQKIKRLSKNNVAQWMVSYLHLIRIFGNEAAHEIGNSKIRPRSIAVRDITLLLFSTQRVVEFWAENK